MRGLRRPGTTARCGRCQGWHMYWYRHRAAAPSRGPCARCGKLLFLYEGGHCMVCLRHLGRLQSSGADDPTAVVCQQCGRASVRLRRGWCSRCYMYWYRHRSARPLPLPWRRKVKSAATRSGQWTTAEVDALLAASHVALSAPFTRTAQARHRVASGIHKLHRGEPVRGLSQEVRLYLEGRRGTVVCPICGAAF